MQQESLYVFSLIIRCVSCLLCNVALKRQTTHSSMYIHNSILNGASCNAVDGLEDTDFFTGSCFHPITDDTTPWMQVDLGNDYNITYVNFSLREDNYIHGHFELLSEIEIQVSGTITANGSLADPKTCAQYLDTPKLTDLGTQIKINCDTLQTGRYIKVKKLISTELLQFCEIRVFVDIPGISKCPLPPESWICLELCYDADSQSVTCPPESTSTSSGDTATTRPQETSLITGTTDTGPPETTTPSDTCQCSCTTDLTKSELQDYISGLIDEIKIDKQETTVAKSKRSSARDTRTSAKAIGCVGIIIIVFSILALIVSDIVTIINKKTSRSKQNK